MKLFNSFKENKQLINQTEFVNVYSVKCDDKEYTIIIPRERANKKTIIHFIDNTICWSKFLVFLNLQANNMEIEYRFTNLMQKF